MGMSKEEIRIQLGIDERPLISGLSGAKARVSSWAQSFSASLKSNFAGIGPMIVGSLGIGTLVAGFRSLATEVDAIKRMSEKTGLSTGLVQDLRFIAKDAGIAEAAVEQLMDKFTSKLAPGQDAQQALLDLSERFAGMTDPVEKAQLAIEMFGKGGVKLIPILSKGAAGLAEMTKGFNKLSDAEIEAADRLDNRINRFGAYWKKVLGGVLEAAEIIGERMQGGDTRSFNQILVDRAEAEKAAALAKQQTVATNAAAGEETKMLEAAVAQFKKDQAETDKELEESKKEQIRLTKEQIEHEGQLAFQEYKRWQDSIAHQRDKANAASGKVGDAITDPLNFSIGDLAKDNTGWGARARESMQNLEWAQWNVRHGNFGLAGEQKRKADDIIAGIKKENPFLQDPLGDLKAEAILQNQNLQTIIKDGLQIKAA